MHRGVLLYLDLRLLLAWLGYAWTSVCWWKVTLSFGLSEIISIVCLALLVALFDFGSIRKYIEELHLYLKVPCLVFSIPILPILF